MFIKVTRSGHDRHGQQFTQGRFLLLVQPKGDGKAPMRALVRFVALHQLGHFMMGACTACGHRISVSGAYGNDGLPCDVPCEVYDRAVEVPAALIQAWNTGGGWNGVGSEADAMREWAIKTFGEV